MKRISNVGAAVGVVVAGVAVGVPAVQAETTGPTGPTAPTAEVDLIHCVGHAVVGDAQPEPIECFATFAEALGSLGWSVPADFAPEDLPGSGVGLNAVGFGSTGHVVAQRGDGGRSGGPVLNNFQSGLAATHIDATIAGNPSFTLANAPDANGNTTNCLDGQGIGFVGAFWNDRVDSVQHRSCHSIKHFDAINYGVPSWLTQSNDGLPALGLDNSVANKVSSIKYWRN
jgi:hypothetical protein